MFNKHIFIQAMTLLVLCISEVEAGLYALGRDEMEWELLRQTLET